MRYISNLLTAGTLGWNSQYSSILGGEKKKKKKKSSFPLEWMDPKYIEKQVCNGQS